MNEYKVHFYITCGLNPIKEIIYVLWLGKPHYTKSGIWQGSKTSRILEYNRAIINYGIEYADFANMKEGEIKEVFVNLED